MKEWDKCDYRCSPSLPTMDLWWNQGLKDTTDWKWKLFKKKKKAREKRCFWLIITYIRLTWCIVATALHFLRSTQPMSTKLDEAGKQMRLLFFLQNAHWGVILQSTGRCCQEEKGWARKNHLSLAGTSKLRNVWKNLTIYQCFLLSFTLKPSSRLNVKQLEANKPATLLVYKHLQNK